MKKHPVFKLVIWIVLALTGLLYLLFLAGSIYEAAVFPHTPQKVTLAQAVQMDSEREPDFLAFDRAQYISITDAIWQCTSVEQSGYKSILRDRRRTDAVFTDIHQTAIIFIQLDGFYSCDELKTMEITGELQKLYERPIMYKSDTTGETVIDAGTLAFRFCTHCTPTDAIGIPIVLVLIPLLIAWWRRSKRTE